jgi:hypothetical protein
MTLSIMSASIQAFMAQPRFAVVGASTARHKIGNKVLRWQVYQ